MWCRTSAGKSVRGATSCQINKIKSNFAALARHVFALKGERGQRGNGKTLWQLCQSSGKDIFKCKVFARQVKISWGPAATGWIVCTWLIWNKAKVRQGRGQGNGKCNPWHTTRYLARGCKRVCATEREKGRERGRVYEKSITIPSAIRRRVLIFKEVIELASAKCRDNSPTLPHVARLAGAAAAAASCRQIRAATRNC